MGRINTYFLSKNRYGVDNLKFGKIDVGRYPEAAKKFAISDASTSKQLPTLILFRNGEEVIRRPYVDAKGKVTRFFFTAVSECSSKICFLLDNRFYIYAFCSRIMLKQFLI